MINAIDLKDFFNEEDYREYLQKPFDLNGKTFASTGYSAIMLNESLGFKAPNAPASFIKSLLSYFDGFENRTFIDLPPQRPLKMVECQECRGSGLAMDECRECDGLSEVEFNNEYSNYYVTCNSCSGSGKSNFAHSKKPCIKCDGVKMVPCKIGSIETLQGCKVSLVNFDKFRCFSNVKYAYLGFNVFGFVFDGGKGVLMGIS